LVGANGEMFTSTSTPTPSPVGTLLPSSPVKIITYVDYQCPYCAYFENANMAQIKGWLDTGVATLEVRPLSFLDGRGSPNTYSSRAANAAMCVASYSPNNFLAYNKALFENQPEEGTSGPENDELFKTAQSVGVMNSSKIKSCIDAKSYGDWISKTTSTVLDSKYVVPGSKVQVGGTPTIVVNGQQYQFSTMDELTNAARFAQFVQKAAGN
jgi:protein-disulfide isomerase